MPKNISLFDILLSVKTFNNYYDILKLILKKEFFSAKLTPYYRRSAHTMNVYVPFSFYLWPSLGAFLAVNYPRYAELIYQHAEPRSPESLL